jgi:DNA-directed RNA polymerase subunit omega
MARVTVEDCSARVPNLFTLVLVAAKRARQLSNGAVTSIDPEHDKPTVIALREVAEGLVGLEVLSQPDGPKPALTEEPPPFPDSFVVPEADEAF